MSYISISRSWKKYRWAKHTTWLNLTAASVYYNHFSNIINPTIQLIHKELYE